MWTGCAEEVELQLAKRANVRRLSPLLNSQNVISSSFLLARSAGSHSAIWIYPRISAVLDAPLAQPDGLVSSALLESCMIQVKARATLEWLMLAYARKLVRVHMSVIFQGQNKLDRQSHVHTKIDSPQQSLAPISRPPPTEVKNYVHAEKLIFFSLAIQCSLQYCNRPAQDLGLLDGGILLAAQSCVSIAVFMNANLSPRGSHIRSSCAM